MSKMMRRLAALSAVALLVTACGGDDDTADEPAGQPEDTEASAEEPAEQPEQTAEQPEQTAADQDSLVLGVSNLGLSFPFTASISDGMEAAAAELGIQLVTLDAGGDLDTQVNDVQDLIAQGVDGILLIPLDGAAAESIVDDIVAAGIPVMSVAVQVGDASQRDLKDVYPGLAALITQDEIATGAIAGEIAIELVPGGGQVAIVEGAAGFPENTTRVQEFTTVVEAAGFEIVASQPGDWVPDVAQATCQNLITANPDLVLIYALSDDMAAGCGEATEAAGVDVKIVGVGGSSLGIDAITDGAVAGTVCYQPVAMGETALQAMVDLLTGAATFEGDFVSYDTPGITAENLDECVPQW